VSTTAIPHLGRRPSPPSAAQLAASLKRTTFLLSSTRLVISDPVARRTATEAVEQAQALLKRFEGKGLTFKLTWRQRDD
jgi:hypothetical protein